MPFFGGSKSSSSTSVSNKQTSFDSSANGAGSQTVTASDKGKVTLDQRSGYSETKGNSSIRDLSGSDNLVLGTGANYNYETTHVEQLSDDVVARALETVDATTGNAFDFGRSAFDFADQANARTASQLNSAIVIADESARRSAEFADASRATIERIADPAGSTSRVILYVVAGLAALALLFFRPRKAKA